MVWAVRDAGADAAFIALPDAPASVGAARPEALKLAVAGA